MRNDIKQDAETCLFAFWLRGEHIEDADQFDPEDFTDSKMMKEIRDRKEIVQIAKDLGWRVLDVLAISSQFIRAESFYQQALQFMAHARLARLMRQAETMSEGDLYRAADYANEVRAIFEQSGPELSPLDEFLHGMEERRSEKAVRWNIPTLDEWTGGVHRKDLTIIAARPGCGKSSFALQIANTVRGFGQKVLFFPLEMSRNQMIERLLIHDRVERPEAMSRGIVENTDETADYITEASRNLFFYEGEANLSQIEKRIREEKPYLVVIDQLSQMRAPEQKFGTDREQLAYMTNNLKAIALRENVAILLLHQLNRPAESGVATMANLKGSGSCEEDADNVILLTPFDQEQWEALQPMPFYVAFNFGETPVLISLSKHRNGQTGGFFAVFNKPRFHFYERERRTN